MDQRPSFGAPLLAGAVLFALVLAMPAILADGDTLWQIAAGGWVLDHAAVPHTDPFSWTFAGQRWFAHEWGAETLLALADRLGGFRGVMALTALAAATTAGLLLYHLRRFMAAIPALAVMLQAMANCAGSLLARPHVLAWPCLELWCAGLVLARANRRAPSWWLLPVMAVWVNLHGSFMLGLLLPLPFLVEAAFEAGRAWRRPARDWAWFAAASWGVALLNPDTLQGVLFPFHLLAMKNIGWVGEWSPADFSGFHPLELTILLLLGIGLSGRVRLPPLRLLMLAGLVHMALAHWRHDPLLGLVGSLVLAEALGRAVPPEPARAMPGWVRLGMPGVAAACVCVALWGRFQVPLTAAPGAAALAALDKVPADLREQPVLNDYSFGAYLIAHGDRPFIDSRADLYGDAFLGRFREIADRKDGALAAALAAWPIAWTIFGPDSAVVPLLDKQPGWRRLFADKTAVVHVRVAAEAARGFPADTTAR